MTKLGFLVGLAVAASLISAAYAQQTGGASDPLGPYDAKTKSPPNNETAPSSARGGIAVVMPPSSAQACMLSATLPSGSPEPRHLGSCKPGDTIVIPEAYSGFVAQVCDFTK